MSATRWSGRTLAGVLVAAVLVAAAVVAIVVGTGSSEGIEGVVSIEEYGAKGDGKSDDRAAIQEALDEEAPGTTIVFPPGTYNIDGALDVDKQLVIQGHGATLKATAAMPYMLRYRSGARTGVGHGVKGLSLDMNNSDLRNGVRHGFEVRDSWHSVHEVRVLGVRGRTGVYVGPLESEEGIVGAYYNEVRVLVSGGGPLYGDPGSVGVQLEGPAPENASNANVILGRVENLATGVKVGPNTDANVLRELDATGCTIGMDLSAGRTLGYGLWTEVNREADVVVRSGTEARLDFQHFQKPPRVDGDGELSLYP